MTSTWRVQVLTLEKSESPPDETDVLKIDWHIIQMTPINTQTVVLKYESTYFLYKVHSRACVCVCVCVCGTK